LPDGSELWLGQAARCATDGQGTQAGETFAGERAQVRIDRVEMDVQGVGNRASRQAQPIIQNRAGAPFHGRKQIIFEARFQRVHFLCGGFPNF
jgi:hypothetical protein